METRAREEVGQGTAEQATLAELMGRRRRRRRVVCKSEAVRLISAESISNEEEGVCG